MGKPFWAGCAHGLREAAWLDSESGSESFHLKGCTPVPSSDSLWEPDRASLSLYSALCPPLPFYSCLEAPRIQIHRAPRHGPSTETGSFIILSNNLPPCGFNSFLQGRYELLWMLCCPAGTSADLHQSVHDIQVSLISGSSETTGILNIKPAWTKIQRITNMLRVQLNMIWLTLLSLFGGFYF